MRRFKNFNRTSLAFILAASLFAVLASSSSVAEPVRVKYVEGSLHAFMILRTEAGKAVAVGDTDQNVQGSRVTTHLKFHFDDGSVHEETTVFSQRGFFRVLTYHLVESGPSFKDPIEVWVDCPSGQVKVRESKDGKDKISTHHMEIPADLANGIVSTIIKNFSGGGQHTVTMLVATPKPRIVKLVITPQSSEDTFSVEKTNYKAAVYLLKIDIGGIAGAVADVVGKQPPDIHVWVLKSPAPSFLKSVGPISADNTVWQIELASPVWPDAKRQ